MVPSPCLGNSKNLLFWPLLSGRTIMQVKRNRLAVAVSEEVTLETPLEILALTFDKKVRRGSWVSVLALFLESFIF